MFNYPTLRNNTSWNALTEFRREMDRALNELWATPNVAQRRETENEWLPACDVEESSNHYLLTLEMPGVPKDQIKLEIMDHQLTISGERRHEEKKRDGDSWYSERRFGKFHRSFALPAGIDSEKVEASYQDGILKVYVPKAESAKPRQIKLNSSSGSGFFSKLIGQPQTSDHKAEKVA